MKKIMALPRAGLSGLLASRLFASGRENALIAFIARIASVGMVLAVAVLVLVLSVMNGFEQEFRQRILGLVPHATLEFMVPESQWQAIADRIIKHHDVNRVMPYVEFKALLVNKGEVRPLQMQGVDFSRFEAIGGEYLEPAFAANSKTLALGASIAQELKLKVGDKVRLLVMSSNVTSHSTGKPTVYTFHVASLLRTGTELDNALGLIDIQRASELKGLNGAVEGLQLQVSDVFNAKSIGRAFYVTNGQLSRVYDWTQSYGNLYVAIQLSRQMVVMLLAIIVAVAVFNVFVTLGMVVRYKRPEIAILRSMGMARGNILVAFVYQGLLISVPGCLVGLLLGSTLAWLAPELVNTVQILMGIELLSTDIYPINYLPSQIKITDLILIAAVALFMSFIATLYPAWRAANLQPAQVLNEH
jgi:lipoprotein-releasing system permease protein